jgi:hypothetical protein
MHRAAGASGVSSVPVLVVARRKMLIARSTASNVIVGVLILGSRCLHGNYLLILPAAGGLACIADVGGSYPEKTTALIL